METDLKAFGYRLKKIPVDCYPAYTWLWNSIVTREGIRQQIDEMYDAGIRAFYVIGEPEWFRPEKRRTYLQPKYLSVQYLDLVYYAFEYAQEKEMYTWLYDEGDYPSGMACGRIRKEYPHLAMKILDTKIVLLKAEEIFRKPPGLIAAYAGNERVREGSSFSVDTELKLYYYVTSDHEYLRLRADNGSAETTKYFLAFTHEKMKNRFGVAFGQNVKLMFDDEAYMGQWTEDFDVIFSERYGYDIGDYMPYITGDLVPISINQYRAVSDYCMLCGDLVRDNYFKPIRQWLNRHDMLAIGHLDNDNKTNGAALNRYGNMLETLREFDVPGIDVIWGQISYPEDGKCCKEGYDFFPRLASSAARQQGHSRSLSESFGVYGAQVTPELMRFVVNYQAVRGISLFNFQAISYDRETVVSLQFRPNFNSNNPGMDCLRQINEYTARLSYILQNSKADISTALYFPYRSICAGGAQGQAAAEAFERLGDMLERKGVCFDLIDEAFVQQADLEDGILKGKFVSYSSVFMPESFLEPKEIVEKLQKTTHDIVPCAKRINPYLAARRLLFEDGSEGYFICNTAGETVNDTVYLNTCKYPCLIDLYTGELKQADYTVGDEEILLAVTLLRGEGIFVWLTEEPLLIPGRKRTELYATVNEIRVCGGRNYLLDTIKGPYILEDNVGEDVKGFGEWKKSFSGEIIYKFNLPELEPGNYEIDLGEVRYIAKVSLNGNKIAEVTMPPYIVSLEGAKTGDEVTITVANTLANACCHTEYFVDSDIRDVGVYHENMLKEEAKAEPGGLMGPITINKLL